VKNIFAKSGTWKFESVSGQKGFAARQLLWDFGIEKVNNQWRFRNKIGFDSSARYFEITDALEVYVSHEYKGVFRLQ
jgi:hypothetical protein